MGEVLIRYFAVLREQRGCDTETVAVSDRETVGALYARLFPPGPDGAMPVMFAINREYVPASAAVSSGDEVAFIPPLGGG